MKKHFFMAALPCMALLMAAASCENENINPYDYAAKNDTIVVNNGGSAMVRTGLADYPSGSIVWTHDTTLTASVKIPEGMSLYIEPGVHVTCSSKPVEDHPVEIVVLGNLYCMGTAEKPVVISSDTKKPEDWGGIICGYGSQEVVLSHTEIADAGATPTESSISFQNKLFKTTIDGGVPAFHFCNPNGRFVMAHCYLHDNCNDQTYFTGGNGVIYNNVFADSGNSSDGGEAVNVKSGCKLDVAYNLIYNACTNAFKLSNAGIETGLAPTEIHIYNNTVVDCGWRREKNKKGGSIWLEKGIYPLLQNNLVYDCRFGLKQPTKDGADIEHSVLSPNFFFASTAEGVEQMSAESSGVIYLAASPSSSKAGELNPLFVNFQQNDKMNINCQSDDVAAGAPLAYNSAWDFHLQASSPALSGVVASVQQLWPDGLAFYGMKKVQFFDTANDQDYHFACPTAKPFFGAFGTK